MSQQNNVNENQTDSNNEVSRFQLRQQLAGDLLQLYDGDVDQALSMLQAEARQQMQLNQQAATEATILNLLDLFLESQPQYSDHYDAQTQHPHVYNTILKLLLTRGVDLSHGTKSRVLAVYLARRNKEMVDYLLTGEYGFIQDEQKQDLFGLPELLKALKMLDGPRAARQQQKRIDRLQKLGANEKTLGKAKNVLSNLQKEDIPHGSVSGSLAQYVRGLIKRIPASKLEFYALQLPAEPWKQLTDLIHLHPVRDVQLPWFMPRVFGEEAPEESLVRRIEHMSEANLTEMISELKLPYSFLRVKFTLNNKAKKQIAEYAPVSQCIWWLHELRTDDGEVERIVLSRIENGEPVGLNYGRTMERIMFLQRSYPSSPLLSKLLQYAEAQLEELDVPLQPPVVVLGDASSSMGVAVRVATIISSVISALCGGDVVFFNGGAFRPDHMPRNVEDVLRVAASTPASGCTSPAAGLLDYYKSKQKVNTFVVVTDEEENTPADGYMFAELFEKYRKEVHHADVVFVSFLYRNRPGQMQNALKARGIKSKCFRLDSRNPDLSKLDSFLALMSVRNPDFQTSLIQEELRHDQQASLEAEAMSTTEDVTTTSSTTSTTATSTTATSSSTTPSYPDVVNANSKKQ